MWYARFTLLIALIAAPAAWAADSPAPAAGCLSRAEQRAAVASQRAIPLAEAAKKLRARGTREEVVRARLCPHNDGLVYVLTLLSRSGKVSRVTVDAANGELVNPN